MTHRSLETRITEACEVFRGTITNAVEVLVRSNGHDGFEYRVTLSVEEVLKGRRSRGSLDFRIRWVGRWEDLSRWAGRRASFLWFLHDPGESIGAGFHALTNAIRLGPPGAFADDHPPAWFPPGYGMDLARLEGADDVMRRARAFARTPLGGMRFHSIFLPPQSTPDHYFFRSYLVVPVVPALETNALRLITTPQEVIPAFQVGLAGDNSDRLPQWRCDFRAEGVGALQYFKSEANIKLLKSLLDSPDCAPVRAGAAEVLAAWGVAVPPVPGPGPAH